LTTCAFLLDNPVFDKVFTDRGTATIIFYVLQILISEIAKCREYRIGGTATESAEGAFFYCITQSSKRQQVIGASLSMGYFVKDFNHMPRAYPAGDTFSTGFFLYKIEEIFCHIDNTGVFVHNDEPARTHNGPRTRQRFIVNGKIEKLLRQASA
jgi:hypothetical protein